MLRLEHVGRTQQGRDALRISLNNSQLRICLVPRDSKKPVEIGAAWRRVAFAVSSGVVKRLAAAAVNISAAAYREQSGESPLDHIISACRSSATQPFLWRALLPGNASQQSRVDCSRAWSSAWTMCSKDVDRLMARSVELIVNRCCSNTAQADKAMLKHSSPRRSRPSIVRRSMNGG